MSKCYVRPNVSITENQYYKKDDPININYVTSVPSTFRVRWGRFFYNIKISKAEQNKDIYLYDI